MSDIHITPNLKEIGGRIAKLSYREMQNLSLYIHESIAALLDEPDAIEQKHVVTALLFFSDATAANDAEPLPLRRHAR